MSTSIELKYWYLRDHKLFSVLKSSEIKQLCIISKFKKAKKGEYIYFSDEPLKRVYFLKKGMIKIAQTNNDGEEVINDIIRKGDLFGELSLDGNSKNSEYAVAVTNEVFICSFLLQDFENILEKNPSIALGYTKLMGFKFKKLRNRYHNLMFYDVRSRLLLFLYDLSLSEGKEEGDIVKIENHLTHDDIAKLICSTRQSINKALREFEDEKLISYSRKEIIFLQPLEVVRRVELLELD